MERLKGRSVCIAGALLMAAGFMFASYGGSVATPTKLEQIGGMGYYALSSSLSTMGMILALPMVGRLSALFGRKRLAACGMLLQLAGRVVMALTGAPALFIGATVVSNFGTGLYTPLSYAFLSDVTDESERPRYFGLLTTFNALGALAGPLLVGQLVAAGRAPLGFVAYAPVTLIALGIILARFPRETCEKGADQAFDWAGILLLAAGIGCVVLWLSLGGKAFPWLSAAGVLLPLVGALALAALVRAEKRAPNPSVPLHMFTKKRFRTAFYCSALLTACSTSIAAFCIVYAQQVMQVAPQLSATVTMPQTLCLAIGGLVVGRWLSANFAVRGRRAVLLSTSLSAGATFVLFLLRPASPMAMIYAATAMGGVASAINQTAFTPFFQTELKPGEYAAAQGMFSFGSTGGACIFSALAGVLLNAGLGYNHIFLMACCFCLAAALTAFSGFRLPRPAAASPADTVAPISKKASNQGG